MKTDGILFVDDEEDNLKIFRSFFKTHYSVFTAKSAHEGNEILRKEDIAIVLADQRMPGITGVEFLKRVREYYPDKIRMIVTGYTDVEAIVVAINEGEIYQYITKPWDNTNLKVVLDKALDRYNLSKENEQLVGDLKAKNVELTAAYEEIKFLKSRLERENEFLKKEIVNNHHVNEAVGNSKLFRDVLARLKKVSVTDSTVLLLGETGTGKEIVARLIHQTGSRSDAAMVKINCAALPANLIESELFGHEKGAFSGALKQKVGLLEVAHNATAFLDEIGELPLELQPKLLRFLQDGEFFRVGGTVPIHSNARIIAASNRDLAGAVKDEEFRSDLYYRLNVFPINIPPLRERKEDIEPLLWFFIRNFEKKLGTSIESVLTETMQKLLDYDWPGNVRELENVVERSMILSQKGELRIDDWINSQRNDQVVKNDITLSMEDLEKRHIMNVLTMTGGKIAGKGGASEILNLNPSTLRSRIKKLGIIYDR